MVKYKDITGESFGRLTVIEIAGRTERKSIIWKCRCICGNHINVVGSSLRNGHTKSCGCLHVETAIQRGKSSKTHGLTDTPEFNAYLRMIERCYNPNHASYSNYGARGIGVCKRWRFGQDGKSGAEMFMKDMPLKPTPSHTLERINNEGIYEPDNCRWATVKEQANNRRSSRLITWRGTTKTLQQWADQIGINQSVLRRCLKSWPLERALSEPPNCRGRRAMMENEE